MPKNQESTDPAVATQPDLGPLPTVEQVASRSASLSVSFGEHEDGKIYHAAEAKRHLYELGFKTKSEPTSFTIWIEQAAPQ